MWNEQDGFGINRNNLIFENQRVLPNVLWDVEKVAEFLGVSGNTVRAWVYRRKIPYRKVGRCLRFKPQEIEKWTLQN